MRRSNAAVLSKKYFRLYILGAAFLLFFLLSIYLVPRLLTLNYHSNYSGGKSSNISLLTSKAPEIPQVTHLATPYPLKGIYMTSCVAATPTLRENLIKFIDETGLNAVVIDIKDFSGWISFMPEASQLKEAVSPRCLVSDMRELIEELHKKGIYVIGRVTVFQDPVLSNKRPDLAVKKASDGNVWKDFKGLSFTDPAAREVWDYHILISKEAYNLGFDELNYDYIRFPSDGPMKDISFPWSSSRNKAEVLEDFFEYLHFSMKETGAVLSIDLFGMTTINQMTAANKVDDLNIGQVWEIALPYFDYLAPMVYPSHYPEDFNGWPNPNSVPYEVVKFSLDKAVARTVAITTPIQTKGAKVLATTTPPIYTKESYSADKVRPWLQSFNYGGYYGPEKIKAQIQATYDAGLNSWVFWDPANKYDSLRQVLSLP